MALTQEALAGRMVASVGVCLDGASGLDVQC